MLILLRKLLIIVYRLALNCTYKLIDKKLGFDGIGKDSVFSGLFEAYSKIFKNDGLLITIFYFLL